MSFTYFKINPSLTDHVLPEHKPLNPKPLNPKPHPTAVSTPRLLTLETPSIPGRQ